MGDREMLAGCNGLYVGLLSDDELAAFDRLCATGEARRHFPGVGGLMGMAKVQFPAARDAEEER